MKSLSPRQFLKKKVQSPEPSFLQVPNHIAIIMDGNGRWARKRFLPRAEGHRAGGKTVRMVIEEAIKAGVRYLTVFAFSTENWKRPPEEISLLMSLFEHYLNNELALFKEHNVRLRAIGDRTLLPRNIQEALANAEEITKDGSALQFILAVSYGGRDEIIKAAQAFARDVKDGKEAASSLDEKKFRQYLFAPDVPDVDLLIRTSDENRISNFLLWQLAYSEIVVTPVLWPDFSKEEFRKCLMEYGGRTRRFGLTDEQLAEPVQNLS